MSTLDAEMDSEETVQDTDVVEVTDLGQASERTRGVTFMPTFELGGPPYNRLLF
jgi:hypothetical protein